MISNMKAARLENIFILIFQLTMNKDMKVIKTKKTGLVKNSTKPAFNQSFDLPLEESCLTTSFIRLEFRQARAFAVKGTL